MMHKRHFCILVGLLVIVVPGQPSRGDLCMPGLVNGSKYTMHRFAEEDPTKLRCCVRKTCHAGNYAIPCESEDAKDTTVCKPCPPMMWMSDNHPSDLGKKCEPWRRCSRKLGLEVHTNGSSIRDRQCRCKLRQGYYPSDLEGRCELKRDKCPEGKELKTDGSCGFCKPHMFKLDVGYGPCESCPSDSEKMSVNTLECIPCPEGMKNVGDGCQTCAERLEHNQDTENCTLPIPRELPSETDPNRDRSGQNVVYVIITTCGVLLVCLILLIAVVLYMRKYKSKSKAGHGMLENGRTSPSNSSDSTESTVTDKDGSEFKLQPGQLIIHQVTSLVVGNHTSILNGGAHNPVENHWSPDYKGQTDYSDAEGQQNETAEPMVYENKDKVSNC